MAACVCVCEGKRIQIFRAVQIHRGIQRYTEVYRGMERYTEVWRGMERYGEVPDSEGKLSC